MGATLRMNSKGGARWHPYHHSRITTQHSAPNLASIGLDTPLSTRSHAVDSFNPHPPRQITAQYILHQKERADAKRLNKDRFDSALKEFCVKRLTDIWKDTSYVKNSIHSQSHYRAPTTATTFQFEEPAPVKLETYLSPPLSPSPFSFQAPAVGPIPTRGVALRPFVYDVLRRSKTVFPALQVALCYLDSVRDKVAAAVAEVQNGEGLATAEASLESLFDFRNPSEARPDDSPAANATPSHAVTQTVSPPNSDGYANTAGQTGPLDSNAEPPRRIRRRKGPSAPLPPLPPRPSPLICARRMFIAALILACKFTQDRVYSNRAWSRICGLDPREVSRCERALGEALGWRLWVGKGLDEPAQFMRQFMSSEDTPLHPDLTQAGVRKKSQSAETALLTPQSVSGSPFTSPPECSPQHVVAPSAFALSKTMSLPNECFFTQTTSSQVFSRDFSAALKQTSSWYYPGAQVYNASQLTMTPANADLDAMESEHRTIFATDNRYSPYGSTPSLTYDTPSTASSSSQSDEYSFIPAGTVTASSPSYSQCTPVLKQEESDFGFAAPARGHMQFQSGVEGTFEVKLYDDDIVSSHPVRVKREEY